ncbi:Hypothetical predicted protein, partial [Paramuricea clavata]
MAKQICHESLKLTSTVQFSRLASVLLRFSLLTLIFLNLQTFGEGLDFCFDASKEETVLFGLERCRTL